MTDTDFTREWAEATEPLVVRLETLLLMEAEREGLDLGAVTAEVDAWRVLLDLWREQARAKLSQG